MTEFFPDYFFNYLMNGFVLVGLLALFWYSNKMSDKEFIIPRKTFIFTFYFILFALGYLSINYWNYPVTFFGFSYGCLGLTLFAYVLIFGGLFTILSRRYHPVPAILATGFVAFLTTRFFELPTNLNTLYIYFHTNPIFYSEWIVGNILFCCALIPAIYVFRAKWSNIKYLVPLMTMVGVIEFVFVGNLSAYITTHNFSSSSLTPLEWVFDVCRTLTVIGLTLTLFKEPKP